MCTTTQSCSQCGPAHHWATAVWAPSSPARWLRSCQNCVKSLSEREVSLLAGTDFSFSLPSVWGSWVNSSYLGTIDSIVWQFKEKTQVSFSGMSLPCLAMPLPWHSNKSFFCMLSHSMHQECGVGHTVCCAFSPACLPLQLLSFQVTCVIFLLEELSGEIS